jgi:hypothetical protein
MAEWSRTDGAAGIYETRRDHLRGALSGGLNGSNLLTTGIGGSIHDDGAADELSGSFGRDLFFANIGSDSTLDKILGRAHNESLFDLI